MALFLYRRPRGLLPYALYLPSGPAPKRGWPLILFLHGAGERGADGRKQTTVGLGPALQENPSRWPAIVLMPQCPKTGWWRGEPLAKAYEILNQVEAQYGTDPRRVYLTGLSMGGYGVWNLGCQYPERFAALAPICGAGDPFWVWQRLARVPIWNFHGSADGVVPVSFSRALADALAKAGNARAHFTEYPNEEHAVWERVYREPGFIRWLFAQRKASP
ncbi:alpha/beta fold hydrolase [Meiothermus sp. QL-1]|uniref:carboxylesterase family protein n=1 Tax=Meiothermus sp. QL-1 TaxID=2058095 RepID=UPI000E0C0851|nr:alpha/beta fold hydrolase [Meiothermus sp. QL-1]RDI96326.1 alpha/beta fold hydrolase [Meiothermus sp. QL-1]